jgi:hypothetical protein
MQREDAQHLERLLAAGPPLAADGWWALSPPALAFVAGEVGRGRRRLIECGSGLSTIVLARELARGGDGRLWSLEHDPEWARRTRERLAAEGLGHWATVIEAPLAEHPLAPPGCRWYDRRTLAELPDGGVELLLVDGPPAGAPGEERSRYPALPELAPRLAAGALVVLDDAGRPGETWAVDRWEDELAVTFDRRDEGIAVGTVGFGPDPCTPRED